MKKFILLAVSFATISAFAAGIAFQTNPLTLIFNSTKKEVGNSNGNIVPGQQSIAQQAATATAQTPQKEVAAAPTPQELVQRCDELLNRYANIVEEAQKVTNNYDEPTNFVQNPFAGRVLTEKEYRYFGVMLDTYENGLDSTTDLQRLPIKYYFYVRELRGYIVNSTKN